MRRDSSGGAFDGLPEVTLYQRNGKLVLATPDLEPVLFQYFARASSLAHSLPLERKRRELELQLLRPETGPILAKLSHFTFLFAEVALSLAMVSVQA